VAARAPTEPFLDDITDPVEILLIEVRTAREQVRELVERMRAERVLHEARMEALVQSARLTALQRDRLRAALRRKGRP